MLRRAVTLVTCAAVALLVWSTPAWAPFHLVVIDQVFFGTADCPDAQYVMMRMLSPGQGFVTQQHITTQNADGSSASDFGVFQSPLDHADAGDHFIMGTQAAATLFGLTLDNTSTGTLKVADGRVCFGLFGNRPVDCVAYGAFTGDNGFNGTPTGNPVLGMALVRGASTHNNANDFAPGAPAPQNNAGQTGTLGQCAAAAPTPTPTTGGGEATPTATPPVSGGGCPGDCDDTHMVTVGEVIIGVNIALGNATTSQCEAIDTNQNGHVEINELIAAVTALLNGCPA